MNFIQKIQLQALVPDSDCFLCGGTVDSTPTHSKLICHHCHLRLPVLINACPICAMPIKTTEYTGLAIQACGACLKQTPIFDKTIAAFHYEPPISDFITSLKFNAQHHFTPLLSNYLATTLRSHYQNEALPQALIPVPLHPKKSQERGFNQAQLIAQSLSEQLQIPLLKDIAKRIRFTKAQSALNADQRQRNLKGAFIVEPINKKSVALIDDVMTTGATANEISSQLLKAGATRVDIWCVARAFAI